MRPWIPALALALSLCGPATASVLTPEGLGRLTVGMTETEAARRFALRIPRDDGMSGPECRILSRKDWPSVLVMSEAGRITRITLRAGGVRTDAGLRVGSRESEVRRAYGAKVVVTAHKYEDAPARYLTVWTVPGQRGVRYETDARGMVRAIHAGGPSIEYVEGCS